MLPWSEMDSLQHETGAIQARLVALNRGGLLTINSQPAVNGAPSADPHVGWGGPNGCGPGPVCTEPHDPRTHGPVPLPCYLGLRPPGSEPQQAVDGAPLSASHQRRPPCVVQRLSCCRCGVQCSGSGCCWQGASEVAS